MNYFESRTNGEILSRITNDVDTLQMSLNQSLTQLITSVTTLIGVFIMMLSINCVDDSGSTSDPAGFHVHHPDCHEAFPEIFPGSAELSG